MEEATPGFPAPKLGITGLASTLQQWIVGDVSFATLQESEIQALVLAAVTIWNLKL